MILEKLPSCDVSQPEWRATHGPLRRVRRAAESTPYLLPGVGDFSCFLCLSWFNHNTREAVEGRGRRSPQGV